ncbi:hypothetical protein L249_8811, partial [Ophiocordyceps polyrhachis-furcata BCC 54312]
PCIRILSHQSRKTVTSKSVSPFRLDDTYLRKSQYEKTSWQRLHPRVGDNDMYI